MNYLLFVYYNTDVKNSEQKTQEIGELISDVMTSKEIKFMYGDLHSIFNFSSELSFDDMNDFMSIVVADVQQFEYILIPKPRNIGSNFNEDNLKHLLSLKFLKFLQDIPIMILKIVYYLKKRNTFGKMEMEIQDLNGNKIVGLPVSNQKGINIVSWDFNEKGPKVATGKTLDYSGFTTPLVPAGKYKAVLTKGKDKFTHEFEVLNDPKSPITADSRAEQRVATKMLFDN